MQTAATPYDLVLDPAAYAGLQLLETDELPMDSPWHYECMTLLIDVVLHHFRDRPDYYTGGNMFIYFNPEQARNLDYRGPDFFFIKDGVDRSRARGSWAIWEENGRCPDIIIELLSPTTERVDRTTKFTIYEQTLRTPEYFLYDPDTERLEGWRLLGGSYVPLSANEQGWLWSEELGLWLGTWVGEFRTMRDTWLRMYTEKGELVPTLTEAERAEKERQRVRADQERAEKERERQRADQATERADQATERADQATERFEQAQEEIARLRALLQRPATPENDSVS